MIAVRKYSTTLLATENFLRKKQLPLFHKLLFVGVTNYKYSDIELLTKLKGGDQHAFRVIYDQYRSRVYQTALRYLKSTDLAQEVVQDVFMNLWANRSKLPQILSMEAWLYNSAKNDILNRLKRKAVEWKAEHHLGRTALQTEQTPLNHLKDKEYARILREAIDSLPVQQRQVFELARNEKMTYAEIGQKLCISPLTVKTHMSRALQHIRSRMAGFGIEVPVIIFFLKDFF